MSYGGDLPSAGDLVEMFGPNEYLVFHAQRIAFLIATLSEEIDSYAAKESPTIRVLDVGPSFQTGAMGKAFDGAISIDTLGLPNDPVVSMFPVIAKHHALDLNTTDDRSKWISIGPYDVIVFAEVLEHLSTAPEHVLPFLHTLLAKDGMLIIQTPNAVSLPKRVAMVRGRNPFERIREDTYNPGHFREYTGKELVDLCEKAGFRVRRLSYGDHWRVSMVEQARLEGLSSVLKAHLMVALGRIRAELQEGITLVATAV